jgi:selenophosphate synthetase-related protein
VGRFVIEIEPKNYKEMIRIADKYKVNLKKIGTVISKPEIIIKGLKSKSIKLDLNKMKKLYNTTLPNIMDI